MRRSKEPAAGPPTQTAPSPIPAALPRVHPGAETPSDAPGISDLERGRTAALIATLGRVQLTLDLIERRLGRLEDDIREIKDGQETLAEAMLSGEESGDFVEIVQDEYTDLPAAAEDLAAAPAESA